METMTETISFDDLARGILAKIHRLQRLITKKEMAGMAGVSQEDVELFESSGDHRSPAVTHRLLSAYDSIVEGKNESPS